MILFTFSFNLNYVEARKKEKKCENVEKRDTSIKRNYVVALQTKNLFPSTFIHVVTFLYKPAVAKIATEWKFTFDMLKHSLCFHYESF